MPAPKPMLFVCILASASLQAAAPAFDGTALAREAIGRVRTMSLRTREVDWPALETRVLAAASGAKDNVDLLPAFFILLDGLGDGHSFVGPPAAMRSAFKERHGREFDSGRRRRGMTSDFFDRRDPFARPLALGTRQGTHVVVRPGGGMGGPATLDYARNLFGAIAADASSSCGYVVDVRGNTGGNVWPMLGGVSALLGDAVVQYGIDRDGHRALVFRLERDAAVLTQGGKDTVMLRVPGWRALPGLDQRPVAVLIDSASASSGEGIAIAFHGRPTTRFFGQTTYGSATSNENFELAGANLFVTTHEMADRHGTVFPHGVEPDVVLPAGSGAAEGDDAVLRAAQAWLAAQPSCAPPGA